MTTSVCPHCLGTKWRAVEDATGRNPSMVRCACAVAAAADRRIVDARIPSRYARCTFAGFMQYPNPQLNRALDRVKKFANDFPAVDRGLCLVGPTGVGKTHLAVAALHEAMKASGARGLFWDVRDLLRALRATYQPGAKVTEQELLQSVIRAELLVLDDLGAEKPSEWVDETMTLIVNERYGAKRPTIFTTNYEDGPPDSLDCLQARVGVRLHSRLHEMCEFVEWDGGDFRFLPPNGGPGDLVMMWKAGRRPGVRVPRGPIAPARASLKPQGDPNAWQLKWPGGKAGHVR